MTIGFLRERETPPAIWAYEREEESVLLIKHCYIFWDQEKQAGHFSVQRKRGSE